jgi:predicted RNA-binding Zn ribbon-like protein
VQASSDTIYTGVVPLDATLEDDIEPGELEFPFGAGTVALDLVATVGERWRRRFDRLRTSEDLARWLTQAGLASTTIKPSGEDLTDARALRSAIFDCVMARMHRRRGPRDAIVVLNSFAGAATPAPQLNQRWRCEMIASSARACLAAIARDAVHMLATADPERLRECAAHDCSHLFLDRSRPGVRRWCDSARCGNREKTASYRLRRKRLNGPMR